MPAGSEGLCEYDKPLDVVMVTVSSDVLDEFGLQDAGAIRPVVGDIDPLLLTMAMNVGALDGADTLYRQTMQRAMAAQIVQTLRPQSPVSAQIEDRRLQRVIDYIEAHLDQNLGLEDLAGIAAMSPTHFAKAFKAATGKSPLQYVIGERLTRASVLLRTSRLTVAQIAYRVGYNDISRFGRHFKRQFKATPAAWRDG